MDEIEENERPAGVKYNEFFRDFYFELQEARRRNSTDERDSQLIRSLDDYEGEITDILFISHWLKSFSGVKINECFSGYISQGNNKYNDYDEENCATICWISFDIDSITNILETIDDFVSSNSGVKHFIVKTEMIVFDELMYVTRWYDRIAMEDFSSFLVREVIHGEMD